jgi:16S rRNA (cytosine1402-N4)-methyltransferase
MKHNTSRPHVSVMAAEVLQYFSDLSISTFFDGTLGAGGHAQMILEAHPEIQTYIACDQDPQAIALAKSYLKPWEKKVQYIQGNFADLEQHLAEIGIKEIDGFFLTWECHRCN